MLNGHGIASAARGTLYESITTEQVIKILCLMAMEISQWPVGLDMKLSQPNK